MVRLMEDTECGTLGLGVYRSQVHSKDGRTGQSDICRAGQQVLVLLSGGRVFYFFPRELSAAHMAFC